MTPPVFDNRVTLSDLVATEAGLRMRREYLAAKGMRRVIAWTLAHPEEDRIVIDMPVTGLRLKDDDLMGETQ